VVRITDWSQVRVLPAPPLPFRIMKATKYKLQNQYQPINITCSPTALSMLLGYYGKDISVDEVSEKVLQVKNEKGEEFGTINQQMAS
jgi:uncharacterized protein YvpB